VGCYKDYEMRRALPKFVKSNVDFDECMWFAKNEGYSLASVQHVSQECWLGQHIADAVQYGPSDNCVPAPFGDGRLRGGPSTNAVYTLVGREADQLIKREPKQEAKQEPKHEPQGIDPDVARYVMTHWPSTAPTSSYSTSYPRPPSRAPSRAPVPVLVCGGGM
jgi:hypothetical protein